MLSMMAIVARPWFEKEDADKSEGDVLQWKDYWADHLPLKRLSGTPANRLYLVTVRPPRFVVWLVAIYEKVTRQGGAWTSVHRNRTPIVDLTPIVGGLRFESGKGLTVPVRLRPQALQAPRALTPGDLALIHDAMRRRGVLAPTDSGDLADLIEATEGGPALKIHLVHERSPRLRAASREYWRHRLGALRCIACQFSFSDAYGATGDDFIELHHIRPLGSRLKTHRNTVADLIPLCSNCHRMVHRTVDNPIDLKGLRAIVRARRRQQILATSR